MNTVDTIHLAAARVERRVSFFPHYIKTTLLAEQSFGLEDGVFST